MNLFEIKNITGAEISIQTKNETEILSLCFDSRQATHLPNELFIALKGATQDGHAYIPELIKKGSTNFLVEKDVPQIEGINTLKVTSSLLALQQIAKHKRSKFKGSVIGITGSNGKTITKEWLTSILSIQNTVLANPKSYNSQLGVPIAVWPIDNKFDFGIFEAGVSKPNEMEALEKVIAPNIGIFTNIGSAHEENFESLEQKIKEKLKLFKQSKTLIYDSDNQLVSTLIDSYFDGKKVGWSRFGNSPIEVESNKGSISVKWSHEDFQFQSEFEDEASIQNLTHAIICALELGLSQQSIQEGINRIRPVKMRLELKRGVRDNFIIDDTYNNDLAGLNKALSFMEQQRAHEKKTLILSDFIQSKVAIKDFEKLNELLISKGIDQLIAIGPQLEKAKNCFSIDSQFFKSTEDVMKSELLNELADRLILIKGSRQFALERVSLLLTEKLHQTKLEINLDSIRHNLLFYKSLLKPKTQIMAVIKALAYGSGSTEVARLLEYNKIDYLAVAYVDEGIALREDGIKSPIMVMNPSEDNAHGMAKYKLEPEIHSLRQLKYFQKAFKALGKKLAAHIVLNTGMNRLGFDSEEINELKLELQANNIEIKTIFSHLAASDEVEHESFSLQQIASFKAMAESINSVLPYKPMLHILNSGGVTRFPEHQLDMVRLGIGLHGVEVNHRYENQLQKPAELKTIISQIRKVRKGESIGYGRKGKAETDLDIAVIAIGYADGYLRVFGNGNAYVRINGHHAKTVGNVCMDMTMVDVTGLEVNEGDEVTVFGESPTVSDLANWANTIPYEILTNVSSRVKRVFYSE